VVVGTIGSVLSILTRVTKAETFVSIAAVFLGPVSFRNSSSTYQLGVLQHAPEFIKRLHLQPIDK